MAKIAFQIASAIFWLFVIGVIISSQEAIIGRFGDGGTGHHVANAVFGVGIIIGIVVNLILVEKIFGSSHFEGDISALPPKEREKFVERQVKEAMKEGNVGRAVVAYENAGFLDKALKLASDKNEHKLAARLQLRMGRRDASRKSYVRGGDFLMAGHLSLLMKEPAAAQEYYAKHLPHVPEQMKPLDKARYLDRAGKYGEAAAIYEEHGDFVRASDAWFLAGHPDKYHAAKEKAVVMAAMEKGRSMNSSASVKIRFVREADSAKEIGDLFQAGWAYRDGDSPKSAGEIFEEIEEWVRAASCYEAAGDTKKAQELRAKARVPDAKKPAPNSPHEEPLNTRVSQDITKDVVRQVSVQIASPASFSSMAPPPVFMAPSSLPPAAAWTDVGHKPLTIQMILPPSAVAMGKAAPSPDDLKGWRDFARVLALNGDLNTAADIHLQGGDLPDAVTCLVDAGRARQAALVALGAGDYAKAAELMVDQIDGGEKEGVGLLLGQLLINLQEFDLAEKLLRNRLAPKVNEATAPLIYQYSRMFEDAGAFEEAGRLYEELIASGATSQELDERLKLIRRKLKAGGSGTASHSGGTNPGLFTSTIRRKMSAADFLADAIRDSDDTVALPPMPPEAPPPASATPAKSAPADVTIPAAAPKKTYKFTPPAAVSTRVEQKTKAETLPTPFLSAAKKNMVSLLGSLATRDAKDASAVPADPFQVEQRYRLDKEIGKGGMGVVYQAQDLLLDRPVALKLLQSFGARQDSLRQFFLEARAIARLNHQNIIHIFDMGVMDLQHYIAMELVTGKDLRSYITEKEKLGLREALNIFVQMAEGLAAAHAGGIVHRDIKPGNILLNDGLQVRIVDFGLAKLQKQEGIQDDGEKTIFRSAGTPGFMAPEQIRGDNVGPAADIYSLGITFFQMLTGQAPHKTLGIHSSEEILFYQLNGDLPSLIDVRPDVPPAIDQLFRFCTARDQKERFQDISQFLPTAKQWLASV